MLTWLRRSVIIRHSLRAVLIFCAFGSDALAPKEVGIVDEFKIFECFVGGVLMDNAGVYASCCR